MAPRLRWRWFCPGTSRARWCCCGISLTTEDDAAFFVRTVRLSQKVGRWPLGTLLRLMPLMVRSAKTPQPHKRELIEDLKQNKAGDAVRVSAEYLDYIAADRDFAAELAASGSHAWVVHVEKGGDGGLTDTERATLESADNVTLVTVPGRCSSSRTRPRTRPQQ